MTAGTDPSSKICLVHPTGNTNVQAVAAAFEGIGILDTFHTCIGIGDDNRNFFASKLFGQRRCSVPDVRLKRYPLRETLRLLRQKAGILPSLSKHETGPLCIDQVYRALDRAVVARLQENSKYPGGIYAYEDGALEVFRLAAHEGLRRIYDLPIGYWRAAHRIQSEEAELKPEWAMTMTALKDSASKLARKDDELRLAESIYVASSFTARTLEEVPFEIPTATVIPYGCPASVVRKAELPSVGKKLRVLYVGSLSQRKGLSYLLDAVELIGNAVELTLVGKRVADCTPLDAALERHHWIERLPHQQILETMCANDVLVFPSLFEGFGLVLTEALSQGLPIISTAHTCAPDLIEDGRQGFIVPVRDAQSIAAKLEFLHKNRDQLNEMKRAATQAAASITWQTYRDRLAASVSTFMKGRSI